MSTLERAIEIAYEAHQGQVDKGGVPYIEHPLQVMTRLSYLPAQITAVMHDVLEDTPVTLQQLAGERFSDEVLGALNAMTHAAGVPYRDYIRVIAGNPVAIRVKMADLLENMRIERVPPDRMEWFTERVKLYQWAHRYLAAELVTFGLEAPSDPIEVNVRYAAEQLQRLRGRG